MYPSIKVIGAKENNLKNINVDIPHGVICGICGVSGSGKSTLAKDVIVQTGLKNFSYSMPSFLRKKLYNDKRPDVTDVIHLPPVLSIDIKNANKTSRSTVATLSGLMSVLRNMYCQYGINKTGNTVRVPRLFSYNISEALGGGACPKCEGKGLVDTIYEESIIADQEKSLFFGGFHFVSDKGVKFTKISDRFLEAFCKEHHISIESSIKTYSEKELELLFWGSEKIINFTDKSGANNGKKSCAFPGIIGALLDVYGRTKNDKISKIIKSGKCSYCNGSRYNENASSYLIQNKKIADVLNMSIVEVAAFIDNLSDEHFERISGLKAEFMGICNELINIGVGYLNLSRNVASVSGGELQRIRLARQISLEMSGYCFVLDEPSAGLHYSDIHKLCVSLEKLKQNGNTVIIVEHNVQVLKYCDYLIELGEKGGLEGGKIVALGSASEIASGSTVTGHVLKNEIINIDKSTNYIDHHNYIKISNINVNNLKNVELCIPMNCLIAVAGVSGSGKSSAIHVALANALDQYLSGGMKLYDIQVKGSIKRFVSLNQDLEVTNIRSTVSTILGIMDTIRDVFAALPKSKSNGYDKSYFSLNNDQGVCLSCKGSGILEDEDGESEEVCPACGGRRFSEAVLKIKYKGYNVNDILSMSIQDIAVLFSEFKISNILKTCVDIGIGYLTLGRSMPTLSKGEHQRIRIAKEINDMNHEHTLFVLDEPSKGLHDADVTCIIHALRKLVQKGHTVIAIEHNLKVITNSDWMIEFGPGAGVNGGEIVFIGTPNELLHAATDTAEAVKQSQNDIYKTTDRKMNHTSFEPEIMIRDVEALNIETIKLKRNQLNLIKGGIASGKSMIARNVLFAVPFKTYMSSVSTQGKYLTRNIKFCESHIERLPFARLVDVTERFYKRFERVSESLGLDYYISNMYYHHGFAKCPCCKENLDLVNALKCNKCGLEFRRFIHKNAFDLSKKTCKCEICIGKGMLLAYDFQKIFNHDTLESQLRKLLAIRTRFSRIYPLINEKYGFDLSKKYSEMNEDEKKLFLYGNKKLDVFYKPKNKTYVWEGCNKLLHDNISYAETAFADEVKEDYAERVCQYCNGKGVDDFLLHTTYKGISFEDILYKKVNWVYNALIKEQSLSEEEERIKTFFCTMNRLCLGEIAVGHYIDQLTIAQKSIVQYLNYRFNPLYNTVILWDDFSAGKSIDDMQALKDDFEELFQLGMTVVLFDDTISFENANIIELGREMKIDSPVKPNHSADGEYGCLFVNHDNVNDNVYEDRIKMILSSKTNIGTISDINQKIKNEFKKKYKNYSFSLQKGTEICERCDGTGYYEMNTGQLGMNQFICPDCMGARFSKNVLACKLHDKNIADVMNMSVKELYDWLYNPYPNVAKLLKLFLDIGIEHVSVNQGINQLSYNEATLVLIARFLLREEQTLNIKNAFIDINSDTLNDFVYRIDNVCKQNQKRIHLYLEKR